MNHRTPSDLADNAPRFAVPSPHGHVESWFVRANHPTQPQAIWLKITVLIPLQGTPEASAWVAVFDAERSHTWAARHTEPLDPAALTGALQATVGPCGLELDATGGHGHGSLSRDGTTVSWDLRWTRVDGPLGDPLCLLPSRRLIDGGFPRSKALTPMPACTFSGTIHWDGETWDAAGWHGMQGHNWGREHALEYAWGQCLFTDDAGVPHAMVEGFTARIALGPARSPAFSSLVVRRGDREYRFDRLFRVWRQRATRDDLRWMARLRGPDGDAQLTLQARAENLVCLGYVNPDDALSYCLNSKLSRAILRVNPTNDEGFECRSEHGGALEFLQGRPDARLPEVV